MDVEANHIPDTEEIDGQPPGSFQFYLRGQAGQEIGGLLYVCPCGCGQVGALHFKPDPSPSWDFDGNLDEPTLHPSVHHLINKETHYHGWLIKGIWKSA